MLFRRIKYLAAGLLAVTPGASACVCWLWVHAVVGYPRNWWQGVGKDFGRFESIRGDVCLCLFASVPPLLTATALAWGVCRKSYRLRVGLTATTAIIFSLCS